MKPNFWRHLVNLKMSFGLFVNQDDLNQALMTCSFLQLPSWDTILV